MVGCSDSNRSRDAGTVARITGYRLYIPGCSNPLEKYFLISTVEQKPVSPVWQFISLLAPTVLTGFYLVYGLVGLVLDEKNKLKWSDEAVEVGLMVTAIVVGMNVLVMAYAYYHRLPLRHLLWISPIAHIAICIVLTLIVVLTV